MEIKTEKKRTRFLIILSFITLIVWNQESLFWGLWAVIPSEAKNKSALSSERDIGFVILMLLYFILPVLALFPIIYCIKKLIDNKRAVDKIRKYQKNWIIIILALNTLFYLMLGGFLLSRPNTLYPYPDILGFIQAIGKPHNDKTSYDSNAIIEGTVMITSNGEEIEPFRSWSHDLRTGTDGNSIAGDAIQISQRGIIDSLPTVTYSSDFEINITSITDNLRSVLYKTFTNDFIGYDGDYFSSDMILPADNGLYIMAVEVKWGAYNRLSNDYTAYDYVFKLLIE